MSTTPSDGGSYVFHPTGSSVSHHHQLKPLLHDIVVPSVGLGDDTSARLCLHRNVCYGFQLIDTTYVASHSVTSRSEQPKEWKA